MVTYPEDWEKTTVGTICDFENGKGHEQNVVSYGKYIIINSKFISTEGSVKKYTNEQISPLKKNDITMVMSDLPNGRALAKCYLIEKDDKYTLNQRICRLRSDEDPIFVMNQINRNSFYLDFDDGVQQTNLRKKDILDCPLFMPVLTEQRAIAEIIKSFNAYIDDLAELIKKKKDIRDGAMEDLMSGRIRLEGFDGEWIPGKVGDILKILHGKNQRAVESYNGKYPILGTGGEIGRAKEYLCNWECVLIGRKGTIDRPFYMNTPFWTIDTLYYSKPEWHQCVKFQYYLFCTINWYDYTESSGRPSLAKEDIENIPIFIPSYDEQKAIAAVLTAMDEEIEALEAERDKILQIREAAMDDLLTGRVRLTV